MVMVKQAVCLFAGMTTSLLLTGCTAGEFSPPQVTWGMLIGLGFVLVAGVVTGWHSIKRYRERVIQTEARFREKIVQIEEQRKELESLYRADDELRRHLHVEEVLQSLVDTAVELLHADKGALMVWDEKKERLRARASHGFHPDTVKSIAIAPGEGLAGKVALSGEPAIVEDTARDGRVTPSIVKAENLVSVMQVPIRVAGEVFGVFSADYMKPHHFSEEEKRLLMAFAQRAEMAIETSRLYEREAEIAVMQERNKLARDLHDSVTQSMYGVTLFAEVVGQLLKARDYDKAKRNLKDLKEMALNALSEMRLLIYELRPSAFEQEGLVAALQARLDAVEGKMGLQTHFICDEKVSLPLAIEEGFYRIAQEALNNVLKHSRAQSVTVTIHQDNEKTNLEVADDGIGFDPQQACESGCLGIIGMKERAKEMDAELEIISQPRKGTKVIVWRANP